MHKKGTLYIDLDHTLLNTENYKRALAKALKPLGINEIFFWSTYRKLREKSAFRIESFAALLFKDKVQQKQAARLLYNKSKSAGQFLYPDVLLFLKLSQKLGFRIIIFTYGDPYFQRLKIESITAFRTLLDRVIITSAQTKNRALPLFNGFSAMLDNRPEVLLHYQKKYKFFPILIQRTQEKQAEVNILRPYFSLAQVSKMIKHKLNTKS